MKIVFFYEKDQKIGGSLLQFFNLSNYLSNQTEHDVYYVNCYNENITELIKGTNVKFIDVNQFEVQGFEDAVFVTPPNYVFLLLEKIHSLKNAKILLYDWHAYSSRYLWSQFHDKNVDIAAIYKNVDDKNAIAFMDEFTRLSCENITGFLPQKRFIPVTKEIDSGRYSKVSRKKKDKISLAYLGRLDSDKIYSVINIADNLMETDFDCPIEFHIIGDGNRRNLLDLSQYAGKITFVFTSYLLGEDMYAYLQENVDVLITMGTALLNGAELGIPSVVVPIGNKRFYTNQYTFLYEVTDYTLGWSYDMIPKLNYNFRTLETILREAVQQKEYHGEKCYQHLLDHHQIDQAVELCLNSAQNTELTVEQFIHFPGVQEQWNAFCAFYERTGKDYLTFYDSILGDRRKDQKGRYAKIREKSIKLIDHSLGRMQKVWAYHLKKKNYLSAHKHYEEVLIKLRDKAQSGAKIKVAFLVVYTSTFSSLPIYKLMSNDDRYETSLIAIPDVQRGIQHLRETYENTLKDLKTFDEHVIEGYDCKLDQYLDIGNEYDLIFFNTPYKGMIHEYHNVEYFLDKDVLTFYVNYGFFTLKYGREIVKQDFYNYVWKVFIDSDENLRDLKKVEMIRGKNGVVSGYIKMDSMADAVIEKRTRKRVLICPHHTVSGWTGTKFLALSNFLKYADLILELPQKYPELDFVFRPHPLLFYNLVSRRLWSEEEVDAYIHQMNSMSNMEYDKDSNYFETFANSDAMIHDCGSFTAEYLFTENPCCYMLKDEAQIKDDFLPMGQDCLQHYYKAYEAEDIYHFIEDVVIRGNDPMKQGRTRFSREHLKFNYPNSAKYAFEYINHLLFQQD